jgi:hypothetical protein
MKKHLITLIALAVTFAATAQVPSYVPTNGLVGWWPFNGNANDESGNGNISVLLNGYSYGNDRFGSPNSTFHIDGIDGTNKGCDINFLSGLNEFSISAWFKIEDTSKLGQNPSQTMFNFAPYCTVSAAYNHPYFPAKMGGCLGDAVNWQICGIDNSIQWPLINKQAWHNLLVSHNGIAVKYFLDGLLVDEVTLTFILPIINSANIGHIPVSSGEVFSGSIDDIGIWNRALTQCEILDLYNAELNSLAVSGGLDQSLCEGQSTSLFGTGASTYSWSNNVSNGLSFVPTASTNYIVTGTDVNGCLGTDTVTVAVNANSSSSQTQTALDSYTWPVNGQTYTQSGTYSDTLVNATGCDSIVTLNLTMSYTGIEELNPSLSKKLLRITDLSGKETPFRKNTVLLFIYEDGTVERVFEGE